MFSKEAIGVPPHHAFEHLMELRHGTRNGVRKMAQRRGNEAVSDPAMYVSGQ